MYTLPKKWRVFEYSHKDPYVNFAIDEAIQYQVGKKSTPVTIRLWEPLSPVVYIGLAQDLDRELNLDACQDEGLAIIRRHSGGGAVYSCPGVLNISFALKLEQHPELNNIKRSYRILSDLLIELLKALGLKTRMQGTSDLTLRNRKVAGQAQARKYGCLLHQTSLMFKMDAEAMERYLARPSRMPSYRAKRSHRDFITMLGAKYQARLKKKIQGTLKGHPRGLSKAELARAQDLALKYQDEKWTQKKQKAKDRNKTLMRY